MEVHNPVQPTRNDDLVRVEFVCESCKDGRHGCAGKWMGLGLEIRCSCNCLERAAKSARVAAPSPGSADKEVSKTQ
jgi:hypothetical protein